MRYAAKRPQVLCSSHTGAATKDSPRAYMVANGRGSPHKLPRKGEGNIAHNSPHPESVYAA